jgi:hypothetical protein
MEAPTRASVPFMITHAMKHALRARGHSDEEIAQLTPEGAHKILSTTDTGAVREFLATIVAQARAATKHLTDEGKDAGLLQMFLVHPLDDAAVPYRYALDDEDLVERMTREAASASAAGHNVYIEGRTVRRGLVGKQRGGLADTVAVFALVVDSDADKGAAWTPVVPTSLAVETSPGNAHFWFFLESAVDAATGQALGERLRAATNADTPSSRNSLEQTQLSATTAAATQKLHVQTLQHNHPPRPLQLFDQGHLPEGRPRRRLGAAEIR